jgi:hypothetical protein ilyop_1056
MGKIYDKLIELNKGLVHVTEFNNLESILENGLLSLDELKNRNIITKYCTSNNSRDIDRQRTLSKYVRLAYTPFYDMLPKALHAGDLKNPVILLISPEVLKLTKVKFTIKNAISNDAILYDEDKIFDLLDFEKIYTPRDRFNCSSKEYKNARQSEILVPQKIEIKYIKKVIIEKGVECNFLNNYNILKEEMDIIKLLSNY